MGSTLDNLKRTMPQHRIDMMWKIIGDQPVDSVLKMMFIVSSNVYCDRILHRMIERGINGKMMVESVMNDFDGNIQDYILDLLHSNPIQQNRIIL